MFRVKYKSEEEFGKYFVDVLHVLGFETWQEVYMGRKYTGSPYIDIIAKLHNTYFAFELKLNLNDGVLIQARNNTKFVDYSYAVIPPRRREGDGISEVKKHYAKSYNIGLISIDPKKLVESIEYKLKRDNRIDLIRKKLMSNQPNYGSYHNTHFYFDVQTSIYKIWLNAKRNYRKKRRYKKGQYKGKQYIETFLFIEQKNSVAGSVSGSNKTTPFKRSCEKIYLYLQEHPKATKKEVWDVIGHVLHWSSYNSMCSSFRALGNSLDVMKKIEW